MRFFSKIKISLVVIVLGFVFSLSARAATVELALDKEVTSAKEDIAVLVTINSENQEINTGQAVISYPANLLSVVEIDRTNSFFSFWLEGPAYDNSKGTIRFVGGSTSGYNGAGLKVMRVVFKVKGSGTGRLAITDGAITASDGTGSNVYTTAKGLDINIPLASEFQAVKAERLQKEATLAKELPIQLGLEVPFYPDATKWNSRSASFLARWNIGPDTIGAAVALNKEPNFIPDASPEAMTGSKIFPALADGVWYLHLRLENNIGWSPTLHYRIAIDTVPPNSFKITSNGGLKTDEPSPIINFASSDLVSGISNYVIRLDKNIATTTSQNSYQFSPLLPGVHQLTIIASDKAGNSISQTESLEILPITSPVITSVSRQVSVGDGEILALGTAEKGVDVLLQIQNSQKQTVFEQVVPVDEQGNWSVTLHKPLLTGNYNLLATARNKKLASSFPAISEDINVSEKPVLVIGSLEISETWFFIDLIIVLLVAFGMGLFTYYKWREQLGRRVIVAQRDIVNVLNSLDTDLTKLSKGYSKGDIDKTELSEIKSTLKNMNDNLEKSRRYILDNIRDINK